MARWQRLFFELLQRNSRTLAAELEIKANRQIALGVEVQNKARRMDSLVRSVFVGPNGVRAGWRFLAYAVILIALQNAFQRFLVPPTLDALHAGNGLTAQALLVIEVFEGLAVLVATAILAAFERRRIDAYGLPVRLAFRKRFWEGAAIGVVSAARRRRRDGGHGSDGRAWLRVARKRPNITSWAVASRHGARGTQRRVHVSRLSAAGARARDGILAGSGRVVASLGAAHLMKPDENAIDIGNIVLLGLLLCLTVQRTGSLWLAAGFHCTSILCSSSSSERAMAAPNRWAIFST